MQRILSPVDTNLMNKKRSYAFLNLSCHGVGNFEVTGLVIYNTCDIIDSLHWEHPSRYSIMSLDLCSQYDLVYLPLCIYFIA